MRKTRNTTIDRVAEAARDMIDAFEAGRVPAALAQIFLSRDESRPCEHWSWGNRLLIALKGHDDARGFRQWQTVGRTVRRGQRACYILKPDTRRFTDRDPETGEEVERTVVVGFRGIPVFGLEQTEGRPLPVAKPGFVDELPVIEVARSWGLRIDLCSGGPASYLGGTDGRNFIRLAVENRSTWAHELVHVADGRLTPGGLKTGQHVDQEVVAELGGAVLLECLGYERDADRGGCLEYINRYAGRHAIQVCNRLVDRACQAVALILDTAAEVAAEAEVAAT